MYIGTKMVNATPMSRGAYNELRGWVLPSDENKDDEGYLVEYRDGGKPNYPGFKGYISWSPKEVFNTSYKDISKGLDFGLALRAIKLGQKVARKGWNGKGMWLGLHTEGGSFVRQECGTSLKYPNYISMKTTDNKLVPWVASQTDMLAEDWIIV